MKLDVIVYPNVSKTRYLEARSVIGIAAEQANTDQIWVSAAG